MLGSTGAANMHKKLVQLCLANICQLQNINVQVHYGEPHPFFLRLAKKHKLSLHPQNGGPLGQRMQYALENATGPTLLMGSDCPSITPAILKLCIAALKTNQCVFLPAEDGGYGLVGVNNAKDIDFSSIFESIPWGTENVMKHTRGRLQKGGLSWVEPAIIWDVDRPEDVERLATLHHNRPTQR